LNFVDKKLLHQSKKFPGSNHSKLD